MVALVSIGFNHSSSSLELAADFVVPSRPPVKFPLILKNMFLQGGRELAYQAFGETFV
jgi:hypothetical protein